jgi:hypothetical protein
MKKLIVLLLVFLPEAVTGQSLQLIPRYDPRHTTQHFINGDIKLFCQDTVKYVVEKKRERYIMDWLDPSSVDTRLSKVLKRGVPEFAAQTSMGYLFTIAVMGTKDTTRIVNYITIHVNELTQKVEEVEILLGE